MMKADVLLKNGTVLDPSQDVFEASDIAFADGKVLKRGRDLELQESQPSRLSMLPARL